MKKVVICLSLLSTMALTFAQSVKMAFVDSERIISEYKDVEAARKKLETFTAGLEQEATKKQKAIVDLQQQLQSQALMMSEDKKAEIQRQIVQLTNEYQAFLQKNFGQTGEVAVRNNDLMVPIMQSVKEAIDKVSKEQKYTMVFDSAMGLLYEVPALDITDAVLKVLNAGK